MTQNEFDAEIAKARLKWGFWQRIADAIVNVATIGSTAIPLWLFGDHVIAPLAGKRTVADIGIAFTVTIGLSLAVNVGQAIKGAERKRTIRQQRATISELEAKAGLPGLAERRRLGEADV